MKAQYIVGASLIAAPFVAVSIAMVKVGGWRMLAWVWGFTLVVVAAISGGVALLASGY